MSRGRALKRQRKLIVTVAVAGVTVLLTLMYAVAAPTNSAAQQSAKGNALEKRVTHDIDHSLHMMGSGTEKVTRTESRSPSDSAKSEAPAIPEELLEEHAGLDPMIKDGVFPGSSELLAALDSSKMNGMRSAGRTAGAARVGNGGRGGSSNGRASGFGGSALGGGAGGGSAQPQRSLSADSAFDELDAGSLAVADLTPALDANPPLDTRKFRRGAPLPIDFNPCVRGGLVVSPCVMSSRELLEGLELPSAPGEFGVPPQPRIVRFFDPGPQGGNGVGNGGANGGGNGGGGFEDPANGGGNGGGSFTDDEPATPVPVPAPIFLLSAGLMLLLRRGRG